jgi:hypothetical protein
MMVRIAGDRPSREDEVSAWVVEKVRGSESIVYRAKRLNRDVRVLEVVGDRAGGRAA